MGVMGTLWNVFHHAYCKNIKKFMIGRIIINCAFFVSMVFSIMSCHKAADIETVEQPKPTESPTGTTLDEERAVEIVRTGLLEDLNKLTQVKDHLNVFVGKISFGPEYERSEKTIIEFTIDPEKLDFKCTKKPSSYGDEYFQRVEFTIEATNGVSVRAKEDLDYPLLQPWSVTESLSDSLAWRWRLTHSPESGTKLEPLKEWELEAFPEDEIRFLYESESTDAKVSEQVLASFDNSIKRYFYFSDSIETDEKFVLWLTPLNRGGTYDFTDGTYTIYQSSGLGKLFTKTMEVDEEGLNAGVQQRGILEYVFGPRIRRADRLADKWSPWGPGTQTVRCYYQIDSNGKIEWAHHIKDTGEVTTHELPDLDCLSYGTYRELPVSPYTKLMNDDWVEKLTGWRKLLAKDKPYKSLPIFNSFTPVSFLEKPCSMGMCNHSNCGKRELYHHNSMFSDAYTIDTLANYLSANSKSDNRVGSNQMLGINELLEISKKR
jgi:hypothetical protein